MKIFGTVLNSKVSIFYQHNYTESVINKPNLLKTNKQTNKNFCYHLNFVSFNNNNKNFTVNIYMFNSIHYFLTMHFTKYMPKHIT